MSRSASIHGPHQRIPLADAHERFLAELFDLLWDRYRSRVSYVQLYEQVVQGKAATFFNDHIAFRTFAGQHPMTGIATLSRIFEALGYRAANCYQFDDKHLSAIHYQHANSQLPKLFVSELKVWELPAEARTIILNSLASHRLPISDETLGKVYHCGECGSDELAGLLARVLREFHELPWNLPEKADVSNLNRFSQYAAWVLVHGYNVNHFTSLVNSHGVPELDDIEKTVAALSAVNVPMKNEIEGASGSKLRQTATEAVVIDVEVTDGGVRSQMPWTYAYFELAERGEIVDPTTGRAQRFEGFLGQQATQLFEMTRTKPNN